MSWGFRPALSLTRGSDPGGYVWGMGMSANRIYFRANGYKVIGQKHRYK